MSHRYTLLKHINEKSHLFRWLFSDIKIKRENMYINTAIAVVISKYALFAILTALYALLVLGR